MTLSSQSADAEGADAGHRDFLTISPEKVAFVASRARVVDAKTDVVDPDPGSNESDDRETAVLQSFADDETAEELAAFIDGLSDDEQIELVAIMWIGRGTFGPDEWDDACETAASERVHTTADYLLHTPLLGDYLDDGLAAIGVSYDEARPESV